MPRPLRLLLPLILALGCARQPAPPAPSTRSTLTEELASGRIGVTLTATPGTVRLDRPLFLTFTLSAPETVAAEWPDLADRFDGLEVAGVYESGSRIDRGRVRKDLRVRLVPLAAGEYRLKPLAIAWHETNAPAAAAWARTKPLVFKADPLPPASGFEKAAPPLAVPLSPKIIAWIAAGVLAILLAGYGLYRLVRRLLREARRRQLSPRQRALLELDELAARRLVEQGLVKEFYFELTLVVRRYIERRHGIRAPEQTTEEFLASAGADPRFPRDSLDNLKAFLTAADWVKYANYQPGPEAGPQALQTARQYVERELEAPRKEGG